MPGLPDRPDLDQLRRRARELHRAAIGGDADAVGRLSAVSDRVTRSTPHVPEWTLASGQRAKADTANQLEMTGVSSCDAEAMLQGGRRNQGIRHGDGRLPLDTSSPLCDRPVDFDFAEGSAERRQHSLNSVNANVGWSHLNTYGLTLGLFDSWGTRDHGLYAPEADGGWPQPPVLSL